MKQEYPYVFSLIMAVYNVELYLKEAIESVITQSIGIDKIQLILVVPRITVAAFVTRTRRSIQTIFS